MDRVIADFEGEVPLKGKKTSHKAVVRLVDDTPEGGRQARGKDCRRLPCRDEAVPGFTIPVTDLSKTGEVRFWIKTDFESGFNLQLNSARGKSGSRLPLPLTS